MVLAVVFLVSSLLYTLISSAVPVALNTGNIHDEGYYIERARDIAEGNWLGRYCQYTLMKGPGFPLFLAATALAHISATVAQALVHCLAFSLLGIAAFLLSRSLVLSVAVFEVTLWNFGPDTGRILREGIYQSQFVLSFSLAVFALVSPARWRFLFWLLSGAGLGFMWVTREEGISLVPIFLALVLCVWFVCSTISASLKQACLAVLCLTVGALPIPVAIAAMNWNHYKTFTVVDVKDSFEGALKALQSIKAPDKRALVPISYGVRQVAYKVSPTFSQLHNLFDDPGSPAIASWKAYGCDVRPQTCGDYTFGWFMWAFRDAAFIAGAYANAGGAKPFYQHIQDEVEAACGRASVRCTKSPLPYLSGVSWSELQSIPRAFTSLLLKLILVRPPYVLPGKSFGTTAQVNRAAAFLHVDNWTPVYTVPGNMKLSRSAWAGVKAKATILAIYRLFYPALVFAGLGAFASYACFGTRRNLLFGIALTAWAAVLIRLGLLALIDVTAFPASYHQYISFAYAASAFAALLSLWLALRLFKRSGPSGSTISDDRHLPRSLQERLARRMFAPEHPR